MNELYLATDYKVTKPYLSDPSQQGEGRCKKGTLSVAVQYTKRSTVRNKVGLQPGTTVLCKMPLGTFIRYSNLHHRREIAAVIAGLRVEIESGYTR